MTRSLWPLFLALTACSPQPAVAPDFSAGGYTDGFSDSFDAPTPLFSPERWSGLLTLVDGNYDYGEALAVGEQTLLESEERAFSAPTALRFTSGPGTDENIRKTALIKKNLEFEEGEDVVLQQRVFLAAEWLPGFMTLMDFECEYCLETTPGIRLALDDGTIVVDRGKLGFPEWLVQDAPTPLPLNQWVALTWRMSLSSGEDGRTRVWQDDVLILDALGVNFLQDAVFEEAGFVLPEDKRYHELEIGLTATAIDRDLTMYVDDVVARLAAPEDGD